MATVSYDVEAEMLVALMRATGRNADELTLAAQECAKVARGHHRHLLDRIEEPESPSPIERAYLERILAGRHIKSECWPKPVDHSWVNDELTPVGGRR